MNDSILKTSHWKPFALASNAKVEGKEYSDFQRSVISVTCV